MSEEILTLVKIPLAEIEEWLREKHVLPPVLSEFRLEQNNLILVFKDDDSHQNEVSQPATNIKKRKRRFRKKRNRMKTRGWTPVARITNSKGQRCTIYEPFVDALKDLRLSHEEQRKVVEKILRSNRNKPSNASIMYFLENTLEYLKGAHQQ